MVKQNRMPTSETRPNGPQPRRKHGFTASKFAVVRLEELDALANLRDDAIATYRPINSQELFAVERIALAQLEAGLHTAAMNEAYRPGGVPPNLLTTDLIGDAHVTRQQNRSHCLAVG